MLEIKCIKFLLKIKFLINLEERENSKVFFPYSFQSDEDKHTILN